MWALWPQVLGNYARHVETGEPLPSAVVEAIDAAQLWGEGFGTLEYLAATLLDQAWHRITPETEVGDPIAFEQQALEDAGVAVRAGAAALPDDVLPAHLRRAATRPGTTPTSGRRCSTPTPWSGSRRTAACAGRTATRSGSKLLVRRRLGRPAGRLPRRPRPRRRPGAAAPPPRPAPAASRDRIAGLGCRPRCGSARGNPAGARHQPPCEPGVATALTARGAAAPGRGRRGSRRRGPGGWAGGGRTTVQRCTTCQPLPDFSTSPIGSIGARQSLARSPGSSSTCSDHRQYGQWLR